MIRPLRLTSSTIILMVLAGVSSNVSAQPLFTRDLCGAGAGNVGNTWVSLPTDSDLATAEDICAAIPAAVSVSQIRSFGAGADNWSFDCATGTCTSTSGVIPEPGCLTSGCFCVDDGEGVQIRASVATTFDINGCDTFAPITVLSGFASYLISVPFDTFLVTINDLARYFGLRTTLPQGTVTRLNCATGAFTVCAAGTACGETLLVPGEAYQIRSTAALGAPYLNPVSCNAPLPPAAACPIGSLNFRDGSNLTWGAPAGCPLPLLYDAARGDLDCLRNICSQAVPRTCPSCIGLEDNDVDLSVADAANPPLGQGYWYLVRVDGGTWNGPGAAQCVDLDNMVGAGCP